MNQWVVNLKKKIMKNILTLCLTIVLLVGCGNEQKKEKYKKKRKKTEIKQVMIKWSVN